MCHGVCPASPLRLTPQYNLLHSSLSHLSQPSLNFDTQDIPSSRPPCHESILTDIWHLNYSYCKTSPLSSVNPSYTLTFNILQHPDFPASPQSVIPSLGNLYLFLRHSLLFAPSQSCCSLTVKLNDPSYSCGPLPQLILPAIWLPFPLYHSL